MRRTGGIAPIEYDEITSDLAIPEQMEKFWSSAINKTLLQSLARKRVATHDLLNRNVIVSGCVTDDDLVPAELHLSGRLITSHPDIIHSLLSNVEEADDRLVMHCAYEVDRGTKRILVISNDVDTVKRLLCYMPAFKSKGLDELWVEYGPGEHKRYIPLHLILSKIGDEMCRTLLKAHILTGDDAHSKIGTKQAAFSCDPQKFLTYFGESDDLAEETLKRAENYLVRIWAGARSTSPSYTFDQLRLEQHTAAKPAKPLEGLPPTLSVMAGHIIRAHHSVRFILTLLEPHDIPDPRECGWMLEDGALLPEKCLKPLPRNVITTCKCMGKCMTKMCVCKKAKQKCVIFCHKQTSECQNQ